MLFDHEEVCFKNLIDYWKSMASAEPSSWTETEDYIIVNTGIIAPLYNPIFLKKTAKALPLQTNSCHSFWYDTNRNKKIPPSNLQTLEPLLQAIPVMSMRLDKELTQKSPPDVVIDIIRNGRDLSEWILPVKVAFELDDNMALRYRQCLENIPEKFFHFIVRKNNIVVAAASLFLHEKVAGLYNLAVLPEYRKQGIGSALHYARLNAARERGYQYATLQATLMAATLDKSIGFETHSELSIFKC